MEEEIAEKTKPAVSLDDFDTITNAQAGVRMRLKSLKTGEFVDAWITVHGSDSDVYAQAKTEFDRTILDRTKDSTKGPLTETEIKALQAELLAKCTSKFENMTMDGQPLTYTKASAQQMYLRYPAIKDQVDIFIGKRANFLKA